MGFDYTFGVTKQELVDQVTRTWSNDYYRFECIKKSMRGRQLWTVWERTNMKSGEVARTICLFLFSSFVEYDISGKNTVYGYKSMQESSHPFYYDCPVSFLKMTTEGENPAWREEVLARVNRRKEVNNIVKTIQKGQYITLVGSKIPFVEVYYANGKTIIGQYGGTKYRIPKGMIGQQVTHTWLKENGLWPY